MPDSRAPDAPRSGSSVPPPLFFIVLGAAGLFLGQPNTVAHLPFLTLLFPFCLYALALGAPTAKSALARGFFLGWAGNCASLYWLVFPMHDVASLPLAPAAAGVALLSAYLACFTALAGMGIRHIRFFFDGRGKPASATSALLSPLLPSLLSGMAYAGFEVLCGTLFTGFPWLSLGSAFAFWPAWTQAASLVGSYGLSALYATAAFLAARSLSALSPRERLRGGVLALLVCIALPLFGFWRLAAPLPPPSGPDLALVMIQGNIDQNQKWEARFQEQTLKHYLSLSQNALAEFRKQSKGGKGPALVLWPETAMPFYFQLHREYASALHSFVQENNVNLMFGTLGLDAGQPGQNFLHNRIYLLSPTGLVAGWYDKRHLVPFGEYIPFAAEIPFLTELLQGIDFTPGTKNEPLRLNLPGERRDPLADAPLPLDGERRPEEGLFLGALICYEAIFPYLAQEQVAKGASILVNVSNDAWFRQSSAPWQHLSLTAMRAVEQARPIVRSTNTGISAVIDSRGVIVRKGEKLFATDILAATVSPSKETTLYHRLHPLPQWIFAITALLSLFCPRLRRLFPFRP